MKQIDHLGGQKTVEIIPRHERPAVRRVDSIMDYSVHNRPQRRWWEVIVPWVVGGLLLGWIASQWIDLRGYLGELSLEEKRIDLEIAKIEHADDGWDAEHALGIAVLGMIIAGAAGGSVIMIRRGGR